jgi:hypothetical protein
MQAPSNKVKMIKNALSISVIHATGSFQRSLTGNPIMQFHGREKTTGAAEPPLVCGYNVCLPYDEY